VTLGRERRSRFNNKLMIKENEPSPTSRDELAEELENFLRKKTGPEKYRGQVGLRDVEFQIDSERAKDKGISFPLSSIEEAEACLRECACPFVVCGIRWDDGASGPGIGFAAGRLQRFHGLRDTLPGPDR